MLLTICNQKCLGKDPWVKTSPPTVVEWVLLIPLMIWNWMCSAIDRFVNYTKFMLVTIQRNGDKLQ